VSYALCLVDILILKLSLATFFYFKVYVPVNITDQTLTVALGVRRDWRKAGMGWCLLTPLLDGRVITFMLWLGGPWASLGVVTKRNVVSLSGI